MNRIQVNFKENEVEILQDIFYHAISGMGLGTYIYDENGNKKYLDYNHYENILKKFLACKNEQSFFVPKDLLSDFINAYSDACNVIDSSEMETLTGYEWIDTQAIKKKLIDDLSGVIGS